MSSIEAHRSVCVLLIEDSPDDVELTQEAIKESKLYIDLRVAEDGVEGLAFLRREGTYRDAPQVDFILLDLNMPRMDGREMLAEIKADEKLAHIPVVVLTTSQAEEDILKSYKLHANCYIAKPVDFEQFIKIVQSIEAFWFTIVKLPTPMSR